MIKGLHAMFYTPEADELRSFLRDKLGLPFFDAGDGTEPWPIYSCEVNEIGVHPNDTSFQDISFFCDDIHATVAEMKAKGVEFTEDVVEREYGFVTCFKAPGDLTIQLYQPRYRS